jgi:H+/gluconate symporter-like permease
LETFGIILSLFLLIFFAYRGFSVILFAPVFALLAASLSGLPLMPAYTELFMAKAVVYIKSFFPVFLLGAVFGKLMEDTGLAKGIAGAIIKGLGKERAILSVVLAGAVLTYGGISLFVVVFAVYPFASALFKEAEIPKRLLPATIALGAFSATMDALPGTPQIQNIIPTNFLGTTIYAAPIVGTIGGACIYIAGILWLEHRRRTAAAAGEGYGNHTLNEPEVKDDSKLVSWQIGILPLITVLVVNFVMTNMFNWNPDILEPFKAMKLPLTVAAVKNVVSIWALIIALVSGIFMAIALGYKNLGSTSALAKALNAGAIGSLLAILNTGSEVGYGNVIASLPGFHSIVDVLTGINIGGSPLVSEAVTVNVLAGITGSASGGLSIALDIMSKTWLDWANTIGMSPDILHRVAAMASGGFDTLPHNGAVVTLLAVCGLTHRDSYGDIFVITLLKVATCFVAIALYSLFGIL